MTLVYRYLFVAAHCAILLGAWPMVACANRGDSGLDHMKKTVFGNFTLKILDRQRQLLGVDSVTVELMRANKTILKMDTDTDCVYATSDKPVEGIPRKGCRTMKVSCHTGGSLCCSTLIFLTSCGDGDGVTIVDIGYGDWNLPIRDVNGDGVKELMVHDRQLVCHSLCKAGEKYSVGVFRGVQRLGVWDQRESGWRVDRPGEYPHHDMKLLAQLQSSPAVPPVKRHKCGGCPNDDPWDNILKATPKMLQAAYYTLMAGQAEAQARETLDTLEHWLGNDGVDELFRTVVSAVRDYKPFKTVPCVSRVEWPNR